MSISSFTVQTKPKFKLILLGDQSVGKTCLIDRFVNGKFESQQTPTVGIDFVVTNITHQNRLYRLQLWDTAGQQRFKSLIPSYLRDSHCAIILYDVTKQETSQNVFKWLDLFRDHVDENTAAVIVANKVDLKYRFPKYEQMKKKCENMNINHFEVSAKTGINVKELFIGIIDRIEDRLSQPILSEDLKNSKSSGKKSQKSLASIPEEEISSMTVKLSPHPYRKGTQNKEENMEDARRRKCC